MQNEKKTVVRGVRLEPLLDKYIAIIAEYENRTISNTIQRLLQMAIQEYFLSHDSDFEFDGFMRKKISLEDLEQYAKEWQNEHTKRREIRDDMLMR